MSIYPAHVQRFHMRSMRYQFSISHVPGKDLHIADTLSWAPTSPNTPTDDHFRQQVDNFVHLVTQRTVRSIRDLLKKTDDPLLTLLAYRAIPLKNGYSPAELLMCRKLQTTVPVVQELMQPKLPDYNSFVCHESEMQMKQKRSFDQRQRAPSLDTLMSGDHACIPQSQTKGMVLTEVAPRSYQLTTPSGVLRRNRRQLRWLSSSSNTTGEEDTTPLDDPGHQHTSDSLYHTRHERVSVPPDCSQPT